MFHLASVRLLAAALGFIFKPTFYTLHLLELILMPPFPSRFPLYRTHAYLQMIHKHFAVTLAAAFSTPAAAVMSAKPTIAAAAAAPHVENVEYRHGESSMESHVQHAHLHVGNNSSLLSFLFVFHKWPG